MYCNIMYDNVFNEFPSISEYFALSSLLSAAAAEASIPYRMIDNIRHRLLNLLQLCFRATDKVLV